MDSLVRRIRDLERTARSLEPDAPARRQLRGPVVAYGEDFLESLGRRSTWDPRREDAARIRTAPLGDDPAGLDDLLALLREAVDTPGLDPASAGHLAYIPGGGLYASSLGDYLAAITNRYAGIRFASPGAVEMENLLLDWMAELVGYPEGSAGNLTSGGSIANLVAVVTARHARGLRARNFHEAVVYLTTQTHHCVDKALRIAGMGECQRRYLPVDGGYRMRPDALEAAVAEDRAADLAPWMVVASAGTTDVGAIDPLEPIGEVARREGLWYHVDAAYGGFFALLPELRPRLAGMALSDSLVLDPHKGLFLPYGSGAVLVKDHRALAEAHRYEAAYMQDAVSDAPLTDSPAELSPELTKHFRGLRLWLPLKLHGLRPFRACLEEKLLLTRWFHARVAELGFWTGPEPELSVSTYRWVPGDGARGSRAREAEAGEAGTAAGHGGTGPAVGAEPGREAHGSRGAAADALNRRILERVLADGQVFISSTRLQGRYTLRMAALSFRTRLETLQVLLDGLADAVRAEVGEGSRIATPNSHRETEP